MNDAPKPFSEMLHWKLKAGSHEFPGPDGGTCINEAAIVAAGFKYKKVGSWEDCPPCFSPLVSQFAIIVNDNLNDKDRQDLLPFVTRMAGTRGSDEVEEARALWLVQQIINVDLSKIMTKIGEEAIAGLCKNAKTKKELKIAVDSAKSSSLLSSLLLSSLSLLSSSLLLSSLLSSSSLLSLSLSLSSSLLLSLLSSSSKQRTLELLEGLIAFNETSRQEVDLFTAIERMTKARHESVA